MRQNSFEIEKNKKKKTAQSSKYIAGRIAITAANEKTWKRERGDQEFFSIFSTINPLRFLQGGFVLFNKSICRTIRLMKYRLAYVREIRAVVYARVFRILSTHTLVRDVYRIMCTRDHRSQSTIPLLNTVKEKLNTLGVHNKRSSV